MKTIQELNKNLQEVTQKRYDIMSLINYHKALEKTHRRIEKATETLKDETLSNDFRLYLERCLTRAATEDIPKYLEKIEYFEKKLGYRG